MKDSEKHIVTNRCIYCDGVGTTDEHVVPFALGGQRILYKASCEACRDRAARCELNPLKEIWGETRAYLQFPSKRNKLRNRVFLLKGIRKDGTAVTLELEGEESLGITPFLEFPLPAFFHAGDYQGGSIVCAITTISFGIRLEDFAQKHDLASIYPTVTYQGNDFERMIAKIAYCAVVAAWGLECFEERFVLPCILGTKDDVGFWVGCDPEGRIIPLIGKRGGGDGSFALGFGIWTQLKTDRKIIVVRLKFFVASDAPEYIVAVGSLKDNFVPPHFLSA